MVLTATASAKGSNTIANVQFRGRRERRRSRYHGTLQLRVDSTSVATSAPDYRRGDGLRQCDRHRCRKPTTNNGSGSGAMAATLTADQRS